MSQTARPATKTIAVVGLAGVLTLLTGCYKPSVQSGGLTCATSGKACPDGFTCVGLFCVSGSPDASASTGGHAGTTATGGRIGSGGQSAAGSGGQIGSGGVPGSGGADQPPAIGQACTIMNRNQPNQSDNCEAGVAVCGGSCPQSICYRLCTGDGDCPGTSCSSTKMPGTNICESAYVNCDPVDGQQGCDTGTYCYLLSSSGVPGGGDRTVCDCPKGEMAVGDPCMDSRDCFPRLTCPPTGTLGGGFCRQVCDPSDLLSATACPVGTTCHLFSAKWGYCD